MLQNGPVFQLTTMVSSVVLILIVLVTLGWLAEYIPERIAHVNRVAKEVKKPFGWCSLFVYTAGLLLFLGATYLVNSSLSEFAAKISYKAITFPIAAGFVAAMTWTPIRWLQVKGFWRCFRVVLTGVAAVACVIAYAVLTYCAS